VIVALRLSCISRGSPLRRANDRLLHTLRHSGASREMPRRLLTIKAASDGQGPPVELFSGINRECSQLMREQARLR